MLALEFYRISDAKLYLSTVKITPQAVPSLTGHNSTSPSGSRTDLLSEAASAFQSIPQNFAAISKELRLQIRPRHPKQPSLYMTGKEELLKLPLGRVQIEEEREVGSLALEEGASIKGVKLLTVGTGSPVSYGYLAVWSGESIMVRQSHCCRSSSSRILD